MRKTINPERNREAISDIVVRGVDEAIEKESLARKLLSGKKLRIKHGVDPTTPRLHLGHAVVYRKLRALQDLGHTVVFLIGDFNARLGDPTGRGESSVLRYKKETRQTAKNYVGQVKKILSAKNLEIRRNGEWYDKMSAEDLIKLMARFTVQQMMSRDMFQERLKEGKAIGLHETVYPALQACDSAMLKADVAVAGSDQLFNEMRGRDLQSGLGMPPQDIITMKLLRGTDGKKKMSQSYGNDIGLDEPADEQFGKIMSIPDELIPEYFELLTDVDLKEVDKIAAGIREKTANPRDLKERLAEEVVGWLRGPREGARAKENFRNVFQKKLAPEKMPVFRAETAENWKEALFRAGLAKSLSDAQRLIEQGAVSVDGAAVKSWREAVIIKKPAVLKVGKRRFAKLMPNL
ncbi:MAG: tyrosine--tRNA ligase [Patescibacteria group bacterium]